MGGPQGRYSESFMSILFLAEILVCYHGNKEDKFPMDIKYTSNENKSIFNENKFIFNENKSLFSMKIKVSLNINN